MTIIDKYTSELATYLDVPSHMVTLFWKGRVALYGLLKSLHVGSGDEVIVPGMTCVVVPNAIKYVGAIPIYVDIDSQTFNMDVALLEQAITPKTKVIIAQNTFGQAPDLDRIMALAEPHNITVIEDCTHGFGGRYRGRQNGTIAHASFFSTQWNKTFSTGIGGFSVIRNTDIHQRLPAIREQISEPGFFPDALLFLLIVIKRYCLNRFTYWPLLALYRFLSRHDLIIGSSQGGELTGTQMPDGYFRAGSRVQAFFGIGELKRLAANLAHRKNIASLYDELLIELDLTPAFRAEYAQHTFIKYPLLVSDRDLFLALAEKSRIEMGDWFLSPIHPVTKNFEYWNYTKGSCPVAEKISERIVNLPTHRNIDARAIARISAFLHTHRTMILDF